jgi:hypothetical protein
MPLVVQIQIETIHVNNNGESMFKRFLFCLSLLGLFTSVNSLQGDIESFANYYSTTSQQLTLGEPVVFESQNEVKKFSISDDRKTILCKRKGTYLITYSAIGERNSLSNPGANLGQPNGDIWGLALTLNGNVIDGSSVNVSPPSDDSSIIVGQVIIELKKNDQVRLVNNTHDSGNDLTIDLGGGNGDISASIVLVNLDD